MIKKNLEYAELILHDDYLEFIWNEKSENLTNERYKEVVLAYAEFTEKYKPTRILADFMKLGFIISPELQEWSNKYVFSRSYAAGLRRNATLLPEDVILQMASEQLFDEENAKKKAVRYFSNREEALEWLLEE